MENKWYYIEEKTPICYESGVWDGKKSDVVLVETKNIDYVLAEVYEGFMDGSDFREWIDSSQNGYTIKEDKIRRWMYIPD